MRNCDRCGNPGELCVCDPEKDSMRARISELEDALNDILMHGVDREYGWMMVPKVEWEQVVARANLKPRRT